MIYVSINRMRVGFALAISLCWLSLGGAMTTDELVEALAAQAQSTPARIVTFRETRAFPFRSKPVEVDGVARIERELGSSIEYPSKDAAIIVDEKGLLMRRYRADGKWRQREVAPQDGQAAELMMAALRFDPARIRELFDLSLEGAEPAWKLTLSPKGELAETVGRIELATSQLVVTSVRIDLKGQRSITLRILEETPVDSFSESERARYFR